MTAKNIYRNAASGNLIDSETVHTAGETLMNTINSGQVRTGDAQVTVHIEDMSAGYSGKAVVKHVSMDICSGEIVVLIGPNGAGKSTILKSIVRQLPLVGGHVYLLGKDLKEYSWEELSKTLAVVLTDRIHPEMMTCRDVVASGRYPYTGRMGRLTERDQEIISGALREVHAEEIADRDFANISDGQRQRVMLARALCQEPDVLVLDEPTSFLDIRYKLEFLSICRRLAKERQITVILSLHEIDLAMKIADRIICVDGEHQVYTGKPEDIFTEEGIRSLFRLDTGFFDPAFGSMELPAPAGRPEVFVISDGCSGIPVYRELQRKGVPFAAGILYPNAADYRLARVLAAETVTAEPFAEISDASVEQARQIMNRCGRVINTCSTFGMGNRKLKNLIEEARAAGKLEDRVRRHRS